MCGGCCRRAARLCCLCAAVPTALLALLAALAVPQLLSTSAACTSDASGACKAHEGDGEAAGCADGAFVGTARQPSLGLQHVPVSGKAEFARLTGGGCTVTYALVCSSKATLDVHEDWHCPGKPELRAPAAVSLVGTWEVCASTGTRLQLTRPIIDLTFDMETSVLDVQGCVRVTAPKAVPELRSVRGSFAEQLAALAARKEEVGGCPTWVTEEDRISRGDDFAVLGRLAALAVRQQQRHARKVAQLLKTGRAPRNSEPWMFPSAVALAVAGGGLDGMVRVASEMTCGMPGVPLLPVPAVAVTRHADVARLVADPEQQRGVFIGMGFSEVCFDPTLPIFLSTGSPEHTQARRLWDRVGLDRMHLSEVREVAASPPSLRKKLMDAAGVTMPMLDEIAELVTPLFMEKLWQSRPSSAEAQFFAGYATSGVACIASHIVAKLPILPNKIRKIRAGVLEFARRSPVGRAMAKEIELPEYEDLRSLYAARGPVLDTALQNLADASMFAGLVGTSAMTMNCVKRQLGDPKHVGLFRKNASAYLWELMRTDPVVAGSQQLLRQPWRLRIGGEDAELPAGTRIFAATGLASGYDASVFPDPHEFRTDRPNIGEMMTWNGKLRHVMAQNYTGAPRFCPGQLVSVKIAAKVCAHLTQHLRE